MSDGILLSFSALSSFSSETREEVLDYVSSRAIADVPVAAEIVDEEPADLSLAQTRKFLERCSDKTKIAFKAVAKASSEGFSMENIADALNVNLDEGDLRGVWGGLTKRVRTILNDPEALLIEWTTYEDDEWRGRVSAMTHRSLRRIFNI